MLLKIEDPKGGDHVNTAQEPKDRDYKEDLETLVAILRRVNVSDYVSNSFAIYVYRPKVDDDAKNNSNGESVPRKRKQPLFLRVVCDFTPERYRQGEQAGGNGHNFVGKCKNRIIALFYKIINFLYVVSVHCDLWVLVRDRTKHEPPANLVEDKIGATSPQLLRINRGSKNGQKR
ncbi:MAG TPA: hypothetical protein VKU37_10720 [Verrucomicrobiae bacterium]|nr:hypothetical protein [Verrucomicrobiae bacterium]